MWGVRFFSSILSLLAMAAASSFLTGCANFKLLGKDLDLIDRTYVVTGQIRNAGQFPNVYGVITEWENGTTGKVESADFTTIGNVGVFGFLVERKRDQYLFAFSDENANKLYDEGEAAWFDADASGRPVPLEFEFDGGRKSRSYGELSRDVIIPNDLIMAGRDFVGARDVEEAATKMRIPVALGDIADLDEDRFDSVRGSEGLWQPATFPLTLGIGIFALEPYDPKRIPVLFVYGAAGSPQDWRTFFDKLDRSRYQAWFYFYPTGQGLQKSGEVLSDGVDLLQEHYGFERMHVVAHSMGGLVSRAFVIENVLEEDNEYIDKFVTISTPWNGHEAAAMGVKMAPKVVPSWYDMQTNSDFQREIFSRRLRGRVDHLLIYGHRDPKSKKPGPHETDGTVSVVSMTAEDAMDEAADTDEYHADHVEILSRDDVIDRVHSFLAEG